MAISSNQDITFTVTNVQDGEILVYNASQGTFVNQAASLGGSSNTSTLARNLGTTGTGIFAQANGDFLEFYKIAAGANTTLSLSGNVITIDAKVGTGNIESQTISLTSTNGNLATFTAPNAAGNANVSGYVQINVDTGYDALSDNIGDSANTRLRFGSDDDMDVELHGDKGVFITTGSDANVSHIKMRSMRNIEFHTGAVDTDSEALQINMDGSLRIADRYTLPNVNGLHGQVLTASGNGNVYWSTVSDLTGYVTTAELEAVDNAAFKLNQDNLPTVTNTYDLGSPTKKFAIMYSTRFAGTADLALSSNSLGGVPAANFALKANVYTKDEVNALIAGVSSNVSSNSNTDGITVAANGESYFSDTLSIVAGNGIDIDLNQTGKILTITNEAFFEGGFRNVRTDGDQSTVIVAENREDTLNFSSGNGISITNNPATDTVTFATDDSHFVSLLNTGISGNILPSADATYNLGSPTKRWNELYLSGNSIYIDNQTVSANTSGLYFEGNLLTTKTYVDGAISSATANITYYSNSDVQAYLDAQGYSNVDSDAQTLGLLANVLTISDGNSVDLTSAIATARTGLASTAYVDNALANISDSDAQTLSLAGNVITISGSNSSVDLSTLLGSINTDAQSLSLAGNVITISGSGSSVDLTTLLGSFHTAEANLDGYATETFVSNQVTSANTAMKAYVDATVAKDFFLNVKVDGDQTTVISADSDGDTLNFASGDGVTVTSNSGSDTVTFALDTAYLSDLANTSDARLYTYIDQADANLSTEISQANTAMRSYVDGQVGDLYNAIDNISDTDNQTLTLSGNTITISGSNSSVDLTSALGNISVDLTGYATESFVNTANAQMKEYVDTLALAGGNSNIDLSSYVTEAELNASLANISSGSDGADGVSVSSAAINSGNLILTLSDSSTIDAGNVVGPQGPQGDTGATGPQGPQGDPGPSGADGINGINGSDGADGADGIGITNAAVTDGNLIITYSNTSIQNLGDVRGLQGATGPQGPQGNVGPTGSDGVDVSSATVTNGNLIITLSDASTVDAGNVVGPAGPQGDAGPQGNVGASGADGADGADGVSVSSATVTGSNLIITLSDTSTIDAGNVVGPAGATGPQGPQGDSGPQGPAGADGADGIQLTDISVTTAAASGNGSLSYNNTTGVFTFSPADLSGVSGSYGNTEVQAYLDAQGYSNVDSDAQTLTLFGNTLSISNGNSVDLSSFAGGGSGSSNVSVLDDLTDVNTAGVSDGQALIYDAGNSEWVAGNVSSGGGSSVTRPAQYERFKVNYNTTGAVDSITDLTGGISGVTIDSASGGDITITFTGYDFPPASIMIYGYNHSANSYNVVPFESTMSLREVPGGGSTGSPTAFGSFTTLKLKVREAETGASRGFGTVTHAYIAFNMMG